MCHTVTLELKDTIKASITLHTADHVHGCIVLKKCSEIHTTLQALGTCNRGWYVRRIVVFDELPKAIESLCTFRTL
jgi:hypothetical protein